MTGSGIMLNVRGVIFSVLCAGILTGAVMTADKQAPELLK